MKTKTKIEGGSVERKSDEILSAVASSEESPEWRKEEKIERNKTNREDTIKVNTNTEYTRKVGWGGSYAMHAVVSTSCCSLAGEEEIKACRGR